MTSWPWKALGVRGREGGKQPKVGREGEAFGVTAGVSDAAAAAASLGAARQLVDSVNL